MIVSRLINNFWASWQSMLNFATFNLHYNVVPYFSFVFGNMLPTIITCIAALLNSMEIWLPCNALQNGESFILKFIHIFRSIHKVITPNSRFYIPLPKLILIIQSKIPSENNHSWSHYFHCLSTCKVINVLIRCNICHKHSLVHL